VWKIIIIIIIQIPKYAAVYVYNIHTDAVL